MRILHVIHDFLPRHRAGSEIYCHDLACRQAADGLETHVLCAEYDPSRMHGSVAWRSVGDLPVTEVVDNWRFASFAESYASPRLGRVVEHVLRAITPDVVHVHNLLDLTLELPAIARRLGVPSVATLHDYTLVCPSGGQRVHRAESHVCFEIDVERCARCFRESPFHQQMVLSAAGPGARPLAAVAGLARRLAPVAFARLGRAAGRGAPRTGVDAAAIERRLARARRVFHEVELWVAPSPALGAEYVRLGLPAERLEVSDYGFAPLARPPRGPRDGPLRVGFVGTLAWHKGAHVVIEAARSLPAAGWELDLWGSLDTFPDYVAGLRRAARGLPVRFRGGFDRDAVADVYRELDVLVVASLWPENSPLVVHEAFQSGVAVVGARIGGIPDLVTDGVSGLLYEPFDAGALRACLARLLADPGLAARLAAAPPPVKDLARDAAEWAERYRRVLARPEAA